MRRLLPLLCASLVIAACLPRERQAREDLLGNPLYAEVVADEQIDFLTEMLVAGITDPAVRRAHERALGEVQRLQQWAHDQQDRGEDGLFVSDAYALKGHVLLLSEALHFDYDFEVEAAPGLRVALSKVLLPRTYSDFNAGQFLDLGPVQVTIGPQTYRISQPLKRDAYATVAIYSPDLKVVLGFAQI